MSMSVIVGSYGSSTFSLGFFFFGGGRDSILFSIVVVPPIYIPTNNLGGFSFLYTLSSIYFLQNV